MSHQSPYSYIQRFFLIWGSLIWIIWHLYRTGNIYKLDIRAHRNVRTFLSWLLLVSMGMWMLYDIICIKFKYGNGYTVVKTEVMHNMTYTFVIPRSSAKYDHADSELVYATNVLINLAFVTKSSANFLSLALFMAVTKKRFGTPFGATWEFRLYQVYSVIILVVYPVLQLTAASQFLAVILPQVLYSAEDLTLVTLLFFVNYRLNSLTNKSALTPQLAALMRTYTSANIRMMLFLLMEATLLILNVDILEGLVLYQNNFANDVVVSFFNTGLAFAYATNFQILFPNVVMASSASQHPNSGQPLSPSKQLHEHSPPHIVKQVQQDTSISPAIP